jgi:hypothetical protein
MKNLLIAIFALCLLNTAFAQNSPRQVVVPFVNQAIASTDHYGLVFNYDLSNQPNTKVVCVLSDLYKAWLTYPVNGALVESPTYGGSQTVILSSKDALNAASDVLTADKTGQVTILNNQEVSPASATCFYTEMNK